MTKSHKHEAAFRAEDLHDDSTQAQVLVPYTPQYGYLQEQEHEVNKPLRMTIGLSRKIAVNEAQTIRVARTNIWIASDSVSPYPNAFQILKDTNTYRELNNETDVKKYFASSQRVKARCGFMLNRLIEL